MKPAPFKYAAPCSIEEAIALVGRYGQESRVLAGGQSLMSMMNLRIVRPSVIIDIGRVHKFSEFQIGADDILIGAMVRQSALETSINLRSAVPLLADAVHCIGHAATRSQGTIVGSLCQADPAAEIPVCAVAMNARILVRSQRGERTVPADEFFTGVFSTSLFDDEMVVGVIFPKIDPGSVTAFDEISRRQGDFAMVSTGCVVRLDQQGAFADVRLVFGGVGDTPVRARDAEQFLIGRMPEKSILKSAGNIAAKSLKPFDDLHATSLYRKSIAAVLTERVLERALIKTRAGSH